MPDEGLRVSDAERDAVAAELAEHLKDGRLQVGEFDERLSGAITARTRGDLARLLTDLPRPGASIAIGANGAMDASAGRGQPPMTGRRQAGPPFPLIAILIFAVGVAGIGGISRAAAGGGHPVWAIWWLWWLIPVAILSARRWLRGGSPQGWR